MITGIQNNNYNTPFKGMNVEQIQKFIPQLSSEKALKLYTKLEKESPNDVLMVADKSGKKIMHCRKIEVLNSPLPVGEILYSGSDKISEKLNFINKIAAKIKNGSLYQ